MRLPDRVRKTGWNAGHSRIEPARIYDEPSWKYSNLLVTALVSERLVGPIDNVNRVFFSTYVPLWLPEFEPCLYLRGALVDPGAGKYQFVQAGRAWIVGAGSAPNTDAKMTDQQPRVIYRYDPRVAVPDEAAVLAATVAADQLEEEWFRRLGLDPALIEELG